MWMGNRGGCFHDAAQRLTASRWVNTHWITCRLEFKGWHREVMQPRRYTELFFLDEATAFAAGHRPCFECRRHDAKAFQSAWVAANPGAIPPGARSIGAVDAVLHRERVTRRREKVTFVASLGELPPGAFVVRADSPAGSPGCSGRISSGSGHPAATRRSRESGPPKPFVYSHRVPSSVRSLKATPRRYIRRRRT